MFVFHLNINMKVVILNIKTRKGNNPTISGITEKILMEISDAVSI